MKMKISITGLQKYIYLICISLFFISCGSKQDVVYFQDVDNIGSSKSINNYSPIIRADDMLTITVSDS